ncbi:MAG: hypothetical protein ABR905_04745 [Terracidiphilus sp.]
MIKENYRLTLARRVEEFAPASTESIQKIIEYCDAHPELHLARDIVRVVANTGMTNEELGSLLVSSVNADEKWLFAGEGRASRHAKRILPLRTKTHNALMSLHELNPASSLVLGDLSKRRFECVLARLRPLFPELSRGRLLMCSVRQNFVSRLMLSGIPLSIVKYCLGQLDSASLMAHLPLTLEQKLAILRRNLENFVPEL